MIHKIDKQKDRALLSVVLRATPGATAELGRTFTAYIGPTQTIIRHRLIQPDEVSVSSSGMTAIYRVEEPGIFHCTEPIKGGRFAVSDFAWSGEESIEMLSPDDAAIRAGVTYGEYLTYARRYGSQCAWARARRLIEVACCGDATIKEAAHRLRGELRAMRDQRRGGMPTLKGKTANAARELADTRDRIDYRAERYIRMGERCADWLTHSCDEAGRDEHMEDIVRCVSLCETIRSQCRVETRPSVFLAMQPAIEASAQTFLVRAARTFAPELHPEDIKTIWMYLPFDRRT